MEIFWDLNSMQLGGISRHSEMRRNVHLAKWRKGNTVSSSVWIEAMEKVWRSPIAQHRIRLNRGDIGFGQEAIMARYEQGGSAKKTSARMSPT